MGAETWRKMLFGLLVTWREARYEADRTVRVRVYWTKAESTGQGQDLESNLENLEAAERVDV